MATANVTKIFTDGALGVASEMNANFSDILSFLNESVVHMDGSNAMTAGLTLGADGAAPTEAVTFRQFDGGPPVAQVAAWGLSPANQSTGAIGTYAVWGPVVTATAPSSGWRQLTAKVHFEALAVNIGSAGSKIGSYKVQYSTDGGSVWNNFLVGPTTEFDCDFAVDFGLYANVARTYVLADVTPTAALQFRVAIKSNVAAQYSFRQGTLTVDVVPS